MTNNTDFVRHRDCCICEEFRSREFPYNYYGIPNRFLFESEDFIVLPSLSPLVAGHILLFPKLHISNLMNLPLKKQKDFLDIVGLSYDKISTQFGKVLIFEHGASDINSLGCGINHAHLHMLPLEDDTRKNVEKRVLAEYQPIMFDSLKNLVQMNLKKKSYLIIGNNIMKLALCAYENIPSQYMRRIISIELRNKSWDWKNISGCNEFEETYHTLKNLSF